MAEDRLGRRLGGQSTCCACVRTWVQIPAPQKSQGSLLTPLQSQFWAEGDRKATRAELIDQLASWLSQRTSGPVRVRRKNIWREIEKDAQGQLITTTDTHVSKGTCIHTYTHAHTHISN